MNRQDLSKFSRSFTYLLLLFVLVFNFAIRWHLRDMPLERDEGEYAYAGQLILQGVPPYELAYNMKFPGVYFAYAALMAVFGQPARRHSLGNHPRHFHHRHPHILYWRRTILQSSVATRPTRETGYERHRCPLSWGRLEPFGKRRKEFGGAEGCGATERAGASESA